jgi:hypothetical protein
MIPNAGEESYSFEITEVFSTGEDVLTSFECKDESGFLGVILLYKSEYEGVNMLVEYKVSDTVTEGYMCFDMTVVE